MGILGVFRPFSQKVLMRDHETWFTGLLLVPLDQLFGPFLTPERAKMGHYIGFCFISW